jgi:hypothetical protein
MPSPVAVPIVLADAERGQLQAWARRPTSAQALALRSRIVLACADTPDESNGRIAASLGVSRPMVTKWRNRFAGRPPPLRSARHPDQRVLGEPGRTLVR